MRPGTRRIVRRTVRTSLGAGLLTAVLGSAVALAVGPLHGRTYHGSLPDDWNNAPRWKQAGTATATFMVSDSGRRVLRFSGSYSFFCGDRTSSLRAPKVKISARGTFRATGRSTAGGGTDYYMLSGRFIRGGTEVSLSYLFDAPIVGKHVSDPYSTRWHPAADACESWVHGTIGVKH